MNESTTSTNSASWLQFKSLSTSGCPKLFYRFYSNPSGFELLLTDLIALWSCSLDVEEIKFQAEDEQCSIDPSESTSQFQILMSKLEDSLANGQNHLGLQRPESEILVLRTRNKLPAPLKPLVWIFSLKAMGVSDMAEQILQPCLSETLSSYNQIHDLLQIIKDKDHVISRLLERISSTSIDLSLIFPSITGKTSRRTQVSVEDAKKHVAGMSEFDKNEWYAERSKDRREKAGHSTSDLRVLVEGGGGEKCVIHTRFEHEGWVNRLPDPENPIDESSQSQQMKKGRIPALSRSATGTGNVSQDSQDAFERQATPPRLKSNKRKNSPDTEPPATSPAKRTKTRLGRLRSSKQPNPKGTTRSLSSSSSSADDAERTIVSSNASTATGSASESDIERHKPPDHRYRANSGTSAAAAKSTNSKSNSKSNSRSSSEAESPPTPKHKIPNTQSQQTPSKLGRLSRLKSSSSTHSPSKSPSSSKMITPQKAIKKEKKTPSTATSTSTPSSKHRLGRIGSQRRTDSIQEEEGKEEEPDSCSSFASSTGSPSPSNRIKRVTQSSTGTTTASATAKTDEKQKKQTSRKSEKVDNGSDTETASASASENDGENGGDTTAGNKPSNLHNKNLRSRNDEHDEHKGKTEAKQQQQRELTMEKKADLRRQELKKLDATSNDSGGGGSGNNTATAAPNSKVNGIIASKNKPKRRF